MIANTFTFIDCVHRARGKRITAYIYILHISGYIRAERETITPFLSVICFAFASSYSCAQRTSPFPTEVYHYAYFLFEHVKP